MTCANGKILAMTRATEEIAFQASLLALNAAIEAAEAGEARTGVAAVIEDRREEVMLARNR